MNSKIERIGPIIMDNPDPSLIAKYTFYDKDFFTDESVLKIAYLKTRKGVLLPRYAIQNENVVKDKTKLGKKIDIECSAKPLDKIQEDAVNFIVKNKDCIVNLAPRRGKTVISIMALSKIKRKTLIIVDQDFLVNQWRDRIVEFTNLKKEDIGLIQKTVNDIDKPIVIGMIQTLKNRIESDPFKLRDNLKDFGITIVDETHEIIGTEKLNRALFGISSKRLIGLTATMYRTDNREFLFQDWFGNNLFKDADLDIKPKIYIVKFKSNLSTKDVNFIMNNHTGNAIKKYFNKLKWTRKLMKDTLTVIKISSLIFNLYKRKRKILVISQYIDILQILVEKLKIDFGVSENVMELFTGSVSNLKSVKVILKPSKKLDKEITFSTYKMCNKGVDRPDWDTLIMLTPISAASPQLRQTIGRVCTLSPGKKDAWVFDLCDETLNINNKMLYNRIEKVYKEDEYDIEYITI